VHLIATAEGALVRLWRVDATSRELVWERRHGTVHFSGSGDPFGFPDEERPALARAVAFRADGALVSVGESSWAPVWSPAGEPLGRYEVDGWCTTTAVCASPRGWVVTGDDRGGVRLFDRGEAPVARRALGDPIEALTLRGEDGVDVLTADGTVRRLAVDGDRLVDA
jgi:hypothetical protein